MQLIHHRNHLLTDLALGSLKPLTAGLRATEPLTDIMRIGEIGLEGGRFTLSTLKQALSAFRQISAKPVEIYKLDLKGNDLAHMAELLSTDEDSYASIPDLHTYFTVGSLSDRLFAPNSLNVVFVSHVFSVVPIGDPAQDTIVASLSKDSAFRERRRQAASEDFALLMGRRHEELVQGGMACVDVFGEPLGSPNVYETLAAAVRTAYSRDLVPLSQRKIQLPPHFRSEEEVKSDLQQLSAKFSLVAYEHREVMWPQYAEYLATQNAEKYAEELALFWRKAMSFSLSRQLQPVDVEQVLQQVLGVFKEKARELPPVATVGSHHLLLKKI